MLRYNQKTGDFSLAPTAMGALIAGVFGFGVWMTKMQYDVSGWKDIGDDVKRINRVLLYNHLSVPSDFLGAKWPDAPSPFSPYSVSFYSAPGVAAKRGLE